MRLATSHVYNPVTKVMLKSVSTGSKNTCTLWLTLLSHLDELVRSKSVSTKARAKVVALYIDSEEITAFLWCCDLYTFKHHVTVHILHTGLLIWSLRPGEIVELSVHRVFNEVFKYGDVTLSLVRHEKTDSLIYQIVIVLRDLKFERNLESD